MPYVEVDEYTGTPPNRGQERTAFNTNMEYFFTWAAGFPDSMNASGASIEVLADEAAASASAASDSETAAAASESAAAISATQAAAFANFQGEWADLTGPFDQFDTCSNDGTRWYAKVAIADITANEPTVEDSTWGIVIGSAGQRNAINAGESYTDTDVVTVGLQAELQAYKGQWWDKTGAANPPYFVSHGGGQNLFLYSGDLSNAAWTKSNATVTGSQNDPEGGSGAFRIDKTSTFGAALQIFSQTGVNTLSVKMKQGTLGAVTIAIFDDGTSVVLARLYLDLSTGDLLGDFGSTAIQDYSVVTNNDDPSWVDISITVLSSTSPSRVYFYPGLYSSSATGSVFIFQPQLEQGATVTAYKETTATAIAYTADTVYQLLEPVTDITAEEPGSSSAWGVLGGGLSAPGVQTYTAADEDGSDNIEIDIDCGTGNWFEIDASDSGISSSGAYTINLNNIPDSPKPITIITKGIGYKTAVNFSLPGGWTPHTHSAFSYQSARDDMNAIVVWASPSLMGNIAYIRFGDSAT